MPTKEKQMKIKKIEHGEKEILALTYSYVGMYFISFQTERMCWGEKATTFMEMKEKKDQTNWKSRTNQREKDCYAGLVHVLCYHRYGELTLNFIVCVKHSNYTRIQQWTRT